MAASRKSNTPKRERADYHLDEDFSIMYQLYSPSESELGIYNYAAVSTDAAPCAQVGKDILMRNGSAVEAAIATLICMGVVNCHSMGLGGGFFMTIYDKKNKKVRILDARETAPAGAKEDMFKNNSKNAKVGGLAVAIPGELLGYQIAYNEYCKSFSWRNLFLPSIELCRKGFPVTPHMAMALRLNRDIILKEQCLRDVFVNRRTGDIYREGEIMTRLDLAITLEEVSKRGAGALYGEGNMRKRFVEDIRTFGGIITEEDLQNYSTVWREPTRTTLRNNYTVYSVPPPGSGSVLSYILNVLDGFNLNSDSNWRTLDDISLTFHRVTEIFKYAYAQKMNLEDSEDPSVLQTVQKLLSKGFADETRARIKNNKISHNPEYYGLRFRKSEDGGTAHLSVIAPNGDAVSVTSTVNLYLGCKRVSPSTGILLNNQMYDFSYSRSYEINERNRIKPGRRPMSSMSPTIILDDKGEVWLVIGGNGGSLIITGIALVTMQLLWLQKNVKEAIDMPKIHHQLFPDSICYESRFPKAILKRLKMLGHKANERYHTLSIIMAIHRHKNGKLYANADYRKNGKTDGF
ncbi:glutathione hydrolase 1 proenzyme-like isoform X2 [Centruroides sculpturatus]|uniref:glutathione hydrolase 1 proenzyme-like isoform X2 n=1 Tax=Centruroides sculpturatus TaxID=218467 RepID=UPI000C6CA218|nr:glutathione hydrolase 1 proenzyme-like isoform X2 [Centruroides sculpturatus]